MLRHAVKGLSQAALFLWSALSLANAQDCDPTADRHAVRIAAVPYADGQAPGPSPEIFGRQAFTQSFGGGWMFELLPSDYGWSVRIYDDPDAPNRMDLSAITPPYGSVPNPRDLDGWHFRNSDNTGPNLGDVNAPQTDRLFFFSPALSGTGGFKPSTDEKAPSHYEPSPEDGRGRLTIIDYGLSDLTPGQKARMSYLKFEACLTWPKSDDEKQREADVKSPVFLPEEIEIFGSCGLDLMTYALDAAILPRSLAGDIDGDGAFDEIAQIKRKSDGKRGLAVCRAGTWLDLVGMGDHPVGQALRPGYIDQMEAWHMAADDHGAFGYENEAPWPETNGDVLVLERIEKEMILLYWAGDQLQSRQVYQFVEP